jgi:hypothetical protein
MFTLSESSPTKGRNQAEPLAFELFGGVGVWGNVLYMLEAGRKTMVKEGKKKN